ncbi:hypothetical protein [Stenotrophomonas rhizophila]
MAPVTPFRVNQTCVLGAYTVTPSSFASFCANPSRFLPVLQDFSQIGWPFQFPLLIISAAMAGLIEGPYLLKGEKLLIESGPP